MSKPEQPARAPQEGRRIALELASLEDEAADVFVGIPDDLLDRYLNGRASEGERAEIGARMEKNPLLREAIEALQWALADPAELPDQPPAPWPSIFAEPRSLSDEAPANAWARIAEQLRTYREADLETWGGVDLGMVARAIIDKATPEEREIVDRLMQSRPGLRQSVARVREVLGEMRAAGRREQVMLGAVLVLAISLATAHRLVVQVRQSPKWLGEKCSVGTAPPEMRGVEDSEQPLIEFQNLTLKLSPSAEQIGIQVFSRLHPVEGLDVNVIDEVGRTIDVRSTDADGCATLAAPSGASYRLTIRWPDLVDEGHQ